MIHKFLEDCSNGVESPLDLVPEKYRDYCASINLNDVPIGVGDEAEVALALDVSTGGARVLGKGLNRGYLSLIQPEEIPGTADVVRVEPDSVFVADYKTGRNVHRASESWQMKMLGLMAARAFGRDVAVVQIIHLDVDGSVHKNMEIFDEWDLQEIMSKVVAAVKKIRSLRETGVTIGDVVEGPWCRYCPSFRSCPAKVSLLNHLVATTDEELAGQAKAHLTESNAGQAYEMWRRMKRVVDEVGAAIHAYAESSPIDLGEGKVYGPRETARESLDPGKVIRAVKKHLGEDYILDSVKLTATKAHLNRAIRRYWESIPEDDRPTLKELTGEIMSDLANENGIRRSVTTSIKEHRR